MAFVSQMELIGGICIWLEKKAKVKNLNSRQLNSIIAGANLMIEELNSDHRPAVDGMGPLAWRGTDDTGMSSKFMAWALSDYKNIITPEEQREKHYPRDPEDFGRCYRMLRAVPELLPLVPKMAEHSDKWKALAESWSELEALYVEELPTGNAPKLYARMKALLTE
jgi:hypothetical protein